MSLYNIWKRTEALLLRHTAGYLRDRNRTVDAHTDTVLGQMLSVTHPPNDKIILTPPRWDLWPRQQTTAESKQSAALKHHITQHPGCGWKKNNMTPFAWLLKRNMAYKIKTVRLIIKNYTVMLLTGEGKLLLLIYNVKELMMVLEGPLNQGVHNTDSTVECYFWSSIYMYTYICIYI